MSKPKNNITDFDSKPKAYGLPPHIRSGPAKTLENGRKNSIISASLDSKALR